MPIVAAKRGALPIKILHIADLHIGDRRYGRFDPVRSVNTRLDDQRLCLNSLADTALKERVRAVILAGDIYHSRTPTPAEEDVFAEFIARLSGANIEIFAITGNHERPSNPGRASPLTHIDTLRIPNFHLINEPSVATVIIDGEPFAVAAIPWPLRREIVAAGFAQEGETPSPVAWDAYIASLVRRLAAEVPPDAIAILTAHLWTVDVVTDSPFDPRGEPICRAETLARSPFSYIALGHIHKHRLSWPSPPVVYSGSIDRTDFSEARIAKGAVVVEIDRQTASWRFVETPARRFVDIEMNLEGFPQPAESAAIMARNYDLEGAILRITATQAKGDTPLDGRRLRPKLPEVFFLRIVRKIESGEREPFSARAFTPMDALEEYISRDKSLAPFKDRLMKLARSLSEEVRGK